MKKENNAIVITSIISGVVLLIAILVLLTFQSVSPISRNVVTVEGSSTIKATPDLITVYFNIETKGTTGAEVKDSNTEIFNKLKSVIVAQGFEEEDLKTQGYNIYPNSYWENGKEKQDGYIAYHSLKIEFSTEKLDKLTGVIDAGITAGTNINSINFELTEKSQNEYKAQALKLASEDAQIKADAVASGFGKTAGKLVSVQVSNFGYYPWNVYASTGRTEDSMAVKASVANIQPDEQDITGSVSATFRLQ